jgi:hypothetical protein
MGAGLRPGMGLAIDNNKSNSLTSRVEQLGLSLLAHGASYLVKQRD